MCQKDQQKIPMCNPLTFKLNQIFLAKFKTEFGHSGDDKLSKRERLLSNNIPGVTIGFCLRSKDHSGEIEEGIVNKLEIAV